MYNYPKNNFSSKINIYITFKEGKYNFQIVKFHVFSLRKDSITEIKTYYFVNDKAENIH